VLWIDQRGSSFPSPCPSRQAAVSLTDEVLRHAPAAAHQPTDRHNGAPGRSASGPDSGIFKQGHESWWWWWWCVYLSSRTEAAALTGVKQ